MASTDTLNPTRKRGLVSGNPELSIKNPELNGILSYYNRIKHPEHPFDGFARSDDGSTTYFDREETKRLRACVAIEWVAFAEIMQNLDWIYVPCSISSGLRAHEELRLQNIGREAVDRETFDTTWEAGHKIGPRHGTHVVAPNVSDNLARGNIIRSKEKWREFGIILPVAREAAVRAFLESAGFSNWQSYKEEEFMALWYPVIDRCKGMVLDMKSDWNISRNSIWEMMRGVLIQAGIIPWRPKADIDIWDMEGNELSLLSRTQKIVETLEYQLGHKFVPREAATALAQIFTIDDKIRKIADDIRAKEKEIKDEEANPHRDPELIQRLAEELQAQKATVHHVLLDRTTEELQKMDELKAKIKPILLDHCAQFMRLDDLPQEYLDAFLKIQVGKMLDEVFVGTNTPEENNIICTAFNNVLGNHLASKISAEDTDKNEKLIAALQAKYPPDQKDKLGAFLDDVQAGDHLSKLRDDHPLKIYGTPNQAEDKLRDLTPEQRAPYRRIAQKISRERHDRLSVQTSEDPMTGHEPCLPQRLYDGKERFFEESSKAMIFDDNLFEQLEKWEQLALPFVIGATEIGLYPAAKPMATMVLTDLNRGKPALSRAEAIGQAEALGVPGMDEFPGAIGSDIKENVSRVNSKKAELVSQQLKEKNPGKVVMDTPAFLRMAHAMDYYRADLGFVATPGSSKTDPMMRRALQMKFLDRNVDHAVFQEGWELSSDLVQLRVRARLIQAGLVKRPAGSQSDLFVSSAASPDKSESLLDDIKLLKAEVERVVKANGRAPEQALALARLLMLHDLKDPDLQNKGGPTTRQLINPLTAAYRSMINYTNGEPASFEFQLRKIYEALNAPANEKDEKKHRQASANRKAVMDALKALYKDEQLADDLLKDPKKLEEFILRKHPMTKAEGSIEDFILQFEPELIEQIPVLNERMTIFEEAKDLLIGEHAKAAGWITRSRWEGKLVENKSTNPDEGDGSKAQETPKSSDPNRAAAKEIEKMLVQEYVTKSDVQRTDSEEAMKAPLYTETLVIDQSVRLRR